MRALIVDWKPDLTYVNCFAHFQLTSSNREASDCMMSGSETS